MPHTPSTAIAAPTMPAEKLSTSISNPALVRCWMKASTCLITKAASGPTIMAPRNIGTSAPTTTPMVATAPTTAPRWPWTMRPPVYPMRMGSSVEMIGPTRASRVLLGSHPVGMNSAVTRPQAMNAPMLGMIMPAR